MMTETNDRRLPVGIQSFEKETLRGYLSDSFKAYEQEYGLAPTDERLLAVRFFNIIEAAYNKMGFR